jgi:hypothetical protein
MWRVLVGVGAVGLLAAGGIALASVHSNAPRGRGQEPRLSERRLLRIATSAAARAGDSHPAMIQHSEGTRHDANLVDSGEGVPGREWSYLIAARGHFVARNFEGVPGSAVPRGSVLTLVVSASSGEVTDDGLSDRYPDLARLGPVHTDLRRAPSHQRTGQSAAGLARGRWSALPRAPIAPRGGASVIWTGHQLIVWGGASASHGQALQANGAAYDPSAGRWRPLPAGPLSPRVGQTAVWTGTEMVVWGGYDRLAHRQFRVSADGAAYSPTTRRWRVLPPAPLSARADAIGIWTGGRVILLGGHPAVTSNTARGYRDGAAYDPVRHQWRHIAPPKSPRGHPLTWDTAVGARGRLLAWSQWATERQLSPNSSTSSGGVDLFTYTDRTGRWRLLPTKPSELPAVEEALWTGQEAIVRGSTYNCGPCSGPFVPEATELYTPRKNGWTRLPPDPLGGDHLVSAWTGAALFSFDAGGQYGPTRPGDATAYDPRAKRWRELPGAPFGCDPEQSPQWTGRQILMYCPRPPTGAGSRHDGLAFTIRAN